MTSPSGGIIDALTEADLEHIRASVDRDNIARALIAAVREARAQRDTAVRYADQLTRDYTAYRERAAGEIERLRAILDATDRWWVAAADTERERERDAALAQAAKMREALRELDERHFLDCNVTPACGNCTVCRTRAALAETKGDGK